MNDSRYKVILYIIIGVILSTIAIQVFWNYKNYQNNKQQLINDVQVSLDNAVDTYYANLAEKSTIGFAFESNNEKDIFDKNSDFSKLIKKIDTVNGFQNIDSIDLKSIDGISIYKGLKVDSILNDFHLSHKNFPKKIDSKSSQWVSSKSSDSLNGFQLLTSKVVISITNDTLQLQTIDTLLRAELNRKMIDIDYGLSFKNNQDSIQKFNFEVLKPNALYTSSKSTFLPKKSTLNVHFNNEAQIILKRILLGLLISILLVLAVISCLFYLLKIIKHQKQLAEVKNDLISNITHEFKTPIATIGVALESIQNFNVIDDKAKTKTYLDISNTQLSKLNTMVEKLLETATLDSENLELNKDTYNISEIIITVVEKHKLQNNNKTIDYTIPEHIMASVDVFHFENVINNLLDNAIKYGGDNIKVALEQNDFCFTVFISDDGNSLSKVNKDKIFEKFYRVPKGNTHDVKGFGIGLYYTKKIIEKHNGNINLDLKDNLTTFKITLPNAK